MFGPCWCVKEGFSFRSRDSLGSVCALILIRRDSPIQARRCLVGGHLPSHMVAQRRRSVLTATAARGARVFKHLRWKASINTSERLFEEAATTQDAQKHDKGRRGKKRKGGSGYWVFQNAQHDPDWSHIKQVKDSQSTTNHSWFEMAARTNTFGQKKTALAPFDWDGIKNTELGCWLVELAERSKLPAGRPAATHRPEEPCLNYKLGAHSSATQRNQRAEEWTQKKETWVIIIAISHCKDH